MSIEELARENVRRLTLISLLVVWVATVMSG